MKFVKWFLLCAFMSSNLSAQETAFFPEAFIGKWVSDVKYCDNPDILSKLNIDKHTLYYWEHGGKVLSLHTVDDSEVAAIIKYHGEGETWTGFAHFKLLNDGQTLVEYLDSFEHKKDIRHKCS